MSELLGQMTGGLLGVRTDAMTVVIGLVALVIIVIGVQCLISVFRSVINGGTNNDN